jgi:hypothetical protein
MLSRLSSLDIKTIGSLNLVIQGVMAGATFILALVALFGSKIKQWWVRPAIYIKVGNETPFVEMLDTDDGTTQISSRSREIRIRVSNKGRSPARHCQVFIKELYRDRSGAGGMYKFREFVPQALYWIIGTKSRDIFRELPEYLILARIASPSEQPTTKSTQTLPVSQHSLYIVIEAGREKGKFIEVGTGTIIVPIIIHAHNCVTIIERYIEIFWAGRTADDIGNQFFSIKELTESEFKAKTKSSQ